MSAIGLLILLAFVLFFFEIFAPGGLLALLGVLALGGAATMAFMEHGLLWGIAVFAIGAVGGIVLFFIEIRLIQKTSLGNQLSLRTSIQSQSNPADQHAQNLVGMEGVTLTRLTPSGKVRVNDQFHTARTQGNFLEEGTRVRVVRADTFNLIVEKI